MDTGMADLTVPTELGSILALLMIWKFMQSFYVACDPKLRKIPGPFLSAFTTVPLKIAILSGRRTRYIHALHEKYGKYVRIAPREVATCDITAHHTIHRVGSQFNKGPWYQHQFPTQYDDSTSGVFGILSNKIASHRRRLFQAAGTRKIIAQWEPQVEKLATLAVKKITEELNHQGISDIMKWWTFMVSDVTGALAFGEAFGNTENGQRNQMMMDVDAALPFIGLCAEIPMLKLLASWVPPWLPFSPQRIWARFTSYGEDAVRATRRLQGSENKTLFSKMLGEAGDKVVTDEIIVQEAANIIIAGTDTTAMTLTYLTYAILAHPNVKHKLIDELASCSEHPTWAELERLEYFNHVILETMRLHPAVPGSLTRIVPEGSERVGDHILPAGTQVSTQAWTMQQNPEVFEDPLHFDPDRWLKPTPAMREFMMPFGGASRMCLGQDIARLEILHAVSKLFRRFPDICLSKETTQESMVMVDYFLIKPKGGRCLISRS